MHGPALDLFRDPQTRGQVLRKHRGGEAVLGVVCNGDGFLFGGEGHEADGGAEGFGVVEIHVPFHALDDYRPHARVAGFLGVGVAGEDSRAFGGGVREEIFVFGYAGGGDEDRGRIGGSEDLGDGGFEVRAEGREDGVVHEDSLRGHADLAALEGCACVSGCVGGRGGLGGAYVEEGAQGT